MCKDFISLTQKFCAPNSVGKILASVFWDKNEVAKRRVILMTMCLNVYGSEILMFLKFKFYIVTEEIQSLHN